MAEIEYSRLAWSERTLLLWALFWRAVILALAARGIAWVLSFLVGGVAGVILSLGHRDVESYGVLLGAAGKVIALIVQLIALYLWTRWAIGTRSGRVRLALLEL
jgi:hypothetical protein